MLVHVTAGDDIVYVPPHTHTHTSAGIQNHTNLIRAHLETAREIHWAHCLQGTCTQVVSRSH